MDTLKNLAEIIDKVNNWVGQLFSWSIIVIMILIVFEVISRWVFNSPTIWGLEVITMVYGFHFMMVAAYALLHGSLINIDLLYRYLPERKKAILDILTYLLFFFPFVIISIIYGFEFALESWKGAERASNNFFTSVISI